MCIRRGCLNIDYIDKLGTFKCSTSIKLSRISHSAACTFVPLNSLQWVCFSEKNAFTEISTFEPRNTTRFFKNASIQEAFMSGNVKEFYMTRLIYENDKYMHNYAVCLVRVKCGVKTKTFIVLSLFRIYYIRHIRHFTDSLVHVKFSTDHQKEYY